MSETILFLPNLPQLIRNHREPTFWCAVQWEGADCMAWWWLQIHFFLGQGMKGIGQIIGQYSAYIHIHEKQIFTWIPIEVDNKGRTCVLEILDKQPGSE